MPDIINWVLKMQPTTETMNPIFITTQEALNKAIKAALQEHLQRLLPQAVKQATAKEYLTKKELMKLPAGPPARWNTRRASGRFPLSGEVGLFYFLLRMYTNI